MIDAHRFIGICLTLVGVFVTGVAALTGWLLFGS